MKDVYQKKKKERESNQLCQMFLESSKVNTESMVGFHNIWRSSALTRALPVES